MKLLEERVVTLFSARWRQTVTYWSVFFSFGLCVAFLGPTVLELRCQTASSLQQITWIFFSQQAALLLGSGLGGVRRKTLLVSLWLLFSCSLVISVVFALIPTCHHVAQLAVAMATAGLAMGVIDTVANLQLVRLYQKDSAVFLQALHFFIGLGALVSPLVADPFLSDDPCIPTANSTNSSSSSHLHHPHSTNSSSSSHLHHLGSTNSSSSSHLHHLLSTNSSSSSHLHHLRSSRVAYAFWIMALINLPVPAAVLALMYHERLLPCSRTRQRLVTVSGSSTAGDTGQGSGSFSGCCNLEKLRGRPPTFFILHAVGGAILFLTDGIIGSYSGFVYTYAVSPPLLMSHRTAGCLDSVFWASITAGRLAFIYLSARYAAPRLLAASLVGVIVVQCLLLVFYTSSVFLFMGTTVLGFCISSVFPSMLAFTEDSLDYKGCATTVLVTSASTGEMILQLLVGSVINSRGSYSFMLCGTISSFLSFCLFLLFLYVQHRHKTSCTELSPNMDMKELPDRGG